MKVERLSNEEEALLKELIPKHRCGNTMRETETGFVHPARLDLAAVKAMSVYEDDIFIVTPPKSGTTWTQEIVWLLRNDVDVDGAMVNQFYRVPFIEIQSIMPKDDRRYPEEGTEMNQSNRGWFQSHSIEFIRYTIENTMLMVTSILSTLSNLMLGGLHAREPSRLTSLSPCSLTTWWTSARLFSWPETSRTWPYPSSTTMD